MFISPSIRDFGLNYATTNGTTVHVCSQEPTNLTEATSTYSLGSGPATVGSPANRSPSGREVTVEVTSGGSVSANGTATHWALVDGTELLASGPLAASQVVTAGNPLTVSAAAIYFD